jgi:hypothetical protein
LPTGARREPTGDEAHDDAEESAADHVHASTPWTCT